MQHLRRNITLLVALMLLGGLLPSGRVARAAGPWTVTNTSASGAGSLSQAINDANNQGGNGSILFNIGSAPAGDGYWTIDVSAAGLPDLIASNVVINALMQPGGRTDGRPKIEIRGGVTAFTSGFRIFSAGNTIQGFIINGFVRTSTCAGAIGDCGAGVTIKGAGANGNKLYGNWIGTTADGSAALGNYQAGVAILQGADNNLIGGTAAGQRNVISGNGGSSGRPQVLIGSTPATAGEEMSGNVVAGNLIGLKPNGVEPLPGASHGVQLGDNAVANTIGPGNYISGNSPSTGSLAVFGVTVGGEVTGSTLPNNKIIGNYIGLDVNGAAKPNRSGGVRLTQVANASSGANNLVGEPGAGNVIAGNNGPGVLIDADCRANPTTANVVQNNYIGLSPAGTAAVPNSQAGVQLSDNIVSASSADLGPCNNVIGPGNLIGGNGTDGIVLFGVTGSANPTRNNKIQGNGIGVGVGVLIANAANGINIKAGAASNLVGGGTVNDTNLRNDIRSNGAFGVLIDASPNNTLQGNSIGSHSSASGVGVVIQNAGATGNQLLANTIGGSGAANSIGVRITGAATGNTIGAGNLVDGNNRYGIEITGVGTNNNTVLRSRLTNNGVNGGLDGVIVRQGTGNLLLETTTSANAGKGISLSSGGTIGNGGRAAPLLTLGSGSLTISNLCAGCDVEIFTSAAAEADEGNQFLTRLDNVAGSSVNVPLPITGCQPYLIATVTDTANNTSEFSNQVGPIAACVPSAPNIALTKDTADQNVGPGTYVYLHTLTNTGTAPGDYTLSISSSRGWATLLTPASYTDLAPNTPTQVRVQVVVPAGTPAGTSDSTVLTAVLVDTGASVSNTDVTTVPQTFGFLFEPTTSLKSVLPGNFVDHTHMITNAGNGQDTYSFSISNTGAAQGVTVAVVNPAACANVPPGGSCTVTVRVTVDPTSTAASDVATVTATSQGGSTKQVVDTTQIQQIAVPVLDPLTRSGSGRPGTSVTYVHTLRNAGGLAGSFSVSGSLVPPATNWGVAVQQPVPNSFAPGASRNVTMTVSIPAYDPANPLTYAGAQVRAQLTATAGAGSPTSTADDTTTVLLAPALTFTPTPQTKTGAPSQLVEFSHTIANTGNGDETFTFSSVPPGAGWTITVLDATTLLPISSISVPRAQSRNVIVRVAVPASGTVVNTTYDSSVTATAASDAGVAQSVLDRVTITAAAVPLITPPTLSANSDPGVAATFNHTISNVGNNPGTFNYALEGLPAGWSGSVTQAAPATLNPTEQRALTVLITPAAGAAPGPYTIRVRATATDANAATASALDTLNVNERAALVIAPDYSDLQNPSTVVTYTHTLTNSGNFTDTVALQVAATQPWSVSVTPTSVTLVPSATTKISVTLTIPPGVVAGTVNTAIVTATSSKPPVFDTATDVTTIRAVPGLTLTPPLFVNAGEATRPVTFSYTLLNSGSVPQDYALTLTPPAGWSAVVQPISVTNLLPGESAAIRVVVTAPAGTPDGTSADTLLRATSSVPFSDPPAPPPFAEAIARLVVGPPFDVLIAPDRAGNVLPGQVYRYTHTMTNTGLFSDTFILSTISLLGWDTSASPASVSLGPGETAPVTVTVVVPTSAEAEVEEITRVIARSTSQPNVSDSASDTSTVLRVVGVEISPRQTSTAAAGTLVEFQHRVTNLGNGVDAFTISAVSSRGWTVTIVQPEGALTEQIVAGFSVPVVLQVRIPAGTPLNTAGTIAVRATSVFDPSVYAELFNTLGTPAPAGTSFVLRLPVVAK